MKHFYWSLLCQLPKVLWREAGRHRGAVGIVTLSLTLLTAFNERLGKAIAAGWEGIPPWWSGLVLGGQVLCALLKANYERFCAIETERDALAARLAARPPKVSVTHEYDQTNGQVNLHLQLENDTGVFQSCSAMLREAEALSGQPKTPLPSSGVRRPWRAGRKARVSRSSVGSRSQRGR